MISKKIETAFNKQINEELYSSYLYLSMSADFAAKNLNGFAVWLQAQAAEEVQHAMKFYNTIIERGGTVSLTAIKKPPAKWTTPLKAFQDAYKHEVYISKCIDDLVTLSQKEKDYAAAEFLQWFVAEQVEEEASADEVVQKLKLVGDNKGALYMLDKEMGARKAQAD